MSEGQKFDFGNPMPPGSQVMLVQVSDQPSLPGPGAVQVTAGCGHLCWIAPSSQFLLVVHPNLETVCLRCADVEDLEKILFAPEAENEMNEIYGPGAREALESDQGQQLLRSYTQWMRKRGEQEGEV